MPSDSLTIFCPNCKAKVPLTESLAAPLVEATKQEFKQRLEAKDKESERALEQQRKDIAAEAMGKAQRQFSIQVTEQAEEIATLNDAIRAKNEKLAEAQSAQAQLLRKQRELDDARREMDLTIETKVTQSLTEVRQSTKRELETEFNLQVAERDARISEMQTHIEELKQKSSNTPNRLQGEVLELHLEQLLTSAFVHDSIAPVPKGEFGGDILHEVKSAEGRICGTILWESKRTTRWNDSWLAKLRQDARVAKAELAVIVTSTMPKDTELFDLIDGVWVVSIQCAVPVAVILRQSLFELALARTAGEGQETKAQLVYQYLIGPRFRARVSAIIEKFTDMSEDLDKERKAMQKSWAKREEQIRLVIDSTAGMYGDLQGIAGRTLLEISGLEIEVTGKRKPK